MTAILSKAGCLLKLNLEQALTRDRSGLPLVPQAPFADPNCQQTLEEALSLAKRHTQNGILIALFAIGLAFKVGAIIMDPSKHAHIAAKFLCDYFQEDSTALPLLCDVTVSQIALVSDQSRRLILAQKPHRPSPRPSPVPEMWIFPKYDEDFTRFNSG